VQVGVTAGADARHHEHATSEADPAIAKAVDEAVKKARKTTKNAATRKARKTTVAGRHGAEVPRATIPTTARPT
jgi:hypothetical protein